MTTVQERLKAVGYARVSTEEQTLGYSMDVQRSAIEKVAADKGWELTKIYADEGVSAKDMEGRPQLLMMLEDARVGKFQVLLFTAVDRLTRDAKDYQEIRAWMINYSVRMGETSNPDADFTDPFVEFMFNLKAAMAQLERKILSARVKRAMVFAKAQNKHLGRPPAGCLINDDGIVELDPLGKKVAALLRDDPNVSASIVMKELDIPKYKEAWNLLQSVKSHSS